MFNLLFGEENMTPILDIIKYNEYLVVSLADKTVHVFKDLKIVLIREFSHVIVKMVHHEGRIILGTYIGTMYVLNHEFRIEDIMFGVYGITCMCTLNEMLIIGSRDNIVVVMSYQSELESDIKILSEEDIIKIENKEKNKRYFEKIRKKRNRDYMTSILNGTDNIEYIRYPDFKYNLEENNVAEEDDWIEDERMRAENREMTIFGDDRRKTLCVMKPYRLLMKEMSFMSKIWKRRRYKVNNVQLTKKAVTCINTDNEFIGVGCEDMVGVYNIKFESKWQKKMECNVNSVIIYEGYVYVGLINGKILCEQIKGGNDKYSFNAHFIKNETEKLYHSVNYMWFGQYLYSCGTDGKIFGWDLKDKKQCILTYNVYESIRKFIIEDEYIYLIIEDIEKHNKTSKLLYKKLI